MGNDFLPCNQRLFDVVPPQLENHRIAGSAACRAKAHRLHGSKSVAFFAHTFDVNSVPCHRVVMNIKQATSSRLLVHTNRSAVK